MGDPAIDLTNAERREYWPGPVALEAHRSKARVKLAWGPLGTAKTTWLCWRAQAIAARAAKHNISARLLFVRDTYRNLIDSTFQTFLSWFPDGSAAGYVSQSEPAEFKLNVGGRYHDILFRHGQTEQDASMFLSTEYDGIFLEEIAPAFLPGEKKVSPGIAEGVFDMAYSRLTRKADRAAAVRPELCMTCNSPPLTHWASKRIIDKPQAYLTDLNWAHWCFPVSDNAQNLREDYYASLEKAWEGKHALIARYIRGERIAVFAGIPRFNVDRLDKFRLLCVDPPFRGLLISTADNPLHVKLDANPEGWVRMWKPPIAGHQYAIGADSAEGVEGGDYSAAYVLDRADESIAAAFHGHIEPEAFGTELAKLGYLYNRASIGVETFPSAHGLATALTLKNSSYPRLYWHSSLDGRGNRRQQRLGWTNDSKSKPILIDGVATHLDSYDLVDPETAGIPDRELISELQSFGIMENGSCEAQEGCYDDRVIAFGVALAINKIAGVARWWPALNQTADE